MQPQMKWMILVILTTFVGVSTVAAIRPINKTTNLNGFPVCSIIVSRGYPCEDHFTLTDDGWMLTINRIPRGLTNATGRGVVFYQHGFTDSAAGICMNPREQSLPYILADLGYDVWLGNNRGNGQSMTNMKYKSYQKEFWDWTFDEMGKYDLPANINFVLNATKQKTLTYIGHSQGTKQAFIGFLDPVLAAKVNLFIALAPVTYIHHTGSVVLRELAALHGDELLALLGLNEFGLPDIIQAILPDICGIDVQICAESIATVMGPTTHLNASRLPYYSQYFPSPSSVKDLIHWAQHVRHDVFNKFDYGSAAENMKHYGQPTPPEYDMTKIPSSLKIALFAGTNDYLGDPNDVAHLLKLLPKSNLVFNLMQDGYAHADFILGVDANRIIYPQLLQLLSNYSQPIV